MARLSKPADPPKKADDKTSTIIALWKDAKSEAVPIELREGSVGVILELERRLEREWSADGRDDGGTAYLLCKGKTQVRPPKGRGK